MDRAAPLDGGQPLMMTSILAWVDTNGDRRIDANEEMGQFPVISAEEISRGRIVVISDPSIFINSMQDFGGTWGNQCLINNLVNYQGTVLIDQMNSRTQNTEGMSGIFHVIRTQFILEVLFFGFLVLIAAWMWRKKIL